MSKLGLIIWSYVGPKKHNFAPKFFEKQKTNCFFFFQFFLFCLSRVEWVYLVSWDIGHSPY